MTNNPIDNRILKFIKKHHVLNLATCEDNTPWCCSCFYVFVEEESCFILTSDLNTKHAQQAQLNKNISGTIILETKIVGKIQGIQFSGTIIKLEENDEKKAKLLYLKRFPYAILHTTTLWKIQLSIIKFTDNRLGFGKKIFWKNYSQ